MTGGRIVSVRRRTGRGARSSVLQKIRLLSAIALRSKGAKSLIPDTAHRKTVCLAAVATVDLFAATVESPAPRAATIALTG